MIREDGRLIDGTTINDAIEIIDKSVKRIPICYMTNCVHPDIVYKALSENFNRTEIVKNRFRGIQANAACLSPEELDNCCELMSSSASSLAKSMMKLRKDFNFKIFGGCCGTDDKYIEEIAKILVL
ncbi:MAG: homocysteine S-methyltransferase family protein [Clostridium sp.]